MLQIIDNTRPAVTPTGSQLRLQPVGSLASLDFSFPFTTGARVVIPHRSKDFGLLVAVLTPSTYEAALLNLVDDIAEQIAPLASSTRDAVDEYLIGLNQLRAHLRVGPSAFIEVAASDLISSGSSQPVLGPLGPEARTDYWVNAVVPFVNGARLGDLFDVGDTALTVNMSITETSDWYNSTSGDENEMINCASGVIEYLKPGGGLSDLNSLLGLMTQMSYFDLFTSLHKLAKRDFSDPTMLGFLAANDLKRGALPPYAERLYIYGHLCGHTYAPVLAFWRMLDSLFSIPEMVTALRKVQNPAQYDMFRSHAMMLRALPLPTPLARVVSYVQERNSIHMLTPHMASLITFLDDVIEKAGSSSAKADFPSSGLTSFATSNATKVFESFADTKSLESFYKLTFNLSTLLIPSNQGALDLGYLYQKSSSLFGFVSVGSSLGNLPAKVVADGIAFEGDVVTFADALLSDPIPSIISAGPLTLTTRRNSPSAPQGTEYLMEDDFRMTVPRLRSAATVSRTVGRTGADILDFRGFSLDRYKTSRITDNPRYTGITRATYEFPNFQEAWMVETGLDEASLNKWWASLRQKNDGTINSILSTIFDGLLSGYRSDVSIVRGPEARERNLSVRYTTLWSPSTARTVSLAGDRVFAVHHDSSVVFARTSDIERPKRLFSTLT